MNDEIPARSELKPAKLNLAELNPDFGKGILERRVYIPMEYPRDFTPWQSDHPEREDLIAPSVQQVEAVEQKGRLKQQEARQD